MKCRIFSGVKQFWQLNIYKRHFLSQTIVMLEAHRFLFFLLFLFLIYNIFGDIFQKPRHEETEANAGFRFSILIFGEQIKGS